jgi:site-specific DNA-methyltransferase (adenine-specific)
MSWKIIYGNNLDVLPTLEDNSVDSIVTDPPYELGFMGKKWDSSGIAYNVELWRQCLRVLKPGAHLLAFSGSRTYHRMTVAIEDAGFEIRDMVSWISNKTFPKSLNIEKATKDERFSGWGTGLKPTVEPIVLARKPLIGTVAQNVLSYGTGGMNIDGSRIEAVDQKQLGKYWDRNQSNSNSGQTRIVGQTSIDLRSYKSEQGRWPANVILDEAAAEVVDSQGKDNPSRFFYVVRASKKDREEGLEQLTQTVSEHNSGGLGREVSVEKRLVDTEGVNAPKVRNFHPTVKPTDLMKYLVKLITPPGGVVLDPFVGSGSTGKAAVQEGFDFIGIELTEEYLPIIDGRLKYAEQETKKKEGLF